MKTKKKSLLEQMYDGNFIPSDHIQSQDPEFLPTCKEAEKEYLHLLKLLSEDDIKHFKRLLELNLNMSVLDSSASFTRGFQYGALLMLEIMEARESLYTCS